VTVTTETYAGMIRVADHGESDDVLFVGDATEPLAELIENDIEQHGPHLSVTYWITDKPHTHDEIQEAWLRHILGDTEVEFTVHWSDITGYLYTDEEITVGGHDLLGELRTAAGKYVCLEITYSPNPRS
jgi:hypothetical protein